MRHVTPRISQTPKLNEMIGRVLNNNCFPTMRGRLLYIQKDKCYFEIIENPEYPKYNHCAGQIEYLPESMVVCEIFEN